MKNFKFKEITIIGPGLIGASLGLILKNKKITKSLQEVTLYNFKIKNIYKIDEIICIYLLKSK